MKNKILIVDDEPMLLTALVDKFTREGFTIITAKDGREGLTSALANHPNLILLDIVLPIMDGMAMLSELRKDSWGKDAAVIMLTNLSEAEKVSESLHQSVYNYLIKSSWKLEDIVAKIKQELGIT